MLKRLFKYSGMALLFGVICGVLACCALAFFIFFGDTSHLEKSAIRELIEEQSTVFCDDESTKVGSFIGNSHRQYVSFEKIPLDMVRAIVASEDRYFYDHYGFNPMATLKAFAEGAKNGFKFRRGGSTLTQQTVKNLLSRSERTFVRKFKELVSAFQLERLYSKDEILEFYFNVFHVAGTGRGVGVASRYFFNKKVQDLSLVESAFIAGSVKAPWYYDPFSKYTEEKRLKAKEKAFVRKNYVLGRMLEQGWIKQEQFDEASKVQVPFKRGKFRTKEVNLIDMVRRELNHEEVLEKIGLDSIDKITSAGLKIYTTLNCNLQRQAQQRMRQNLARVETILEGFEVESPDKFKPKKNIEVYEYHYGKVLEIDRSNKKKPKIIVDLGYPKGEIPHESLVRYAKLLDLAKGRGYKKVLNKLIKKIKKGDILYVEVRSYDETTNQAVLELHRRPKVNGGLVVVDGGRIKSAIGGFDKEGYNRAFRARRPPGSVFKTVVFLAAMQLGWSPLQILNNQRNIFVYQGQFYYPRSDHDSPYKDVSMVWTGVMSENLATIDLTMRLLEQLDFNQFQSLMQFMGLMPKANEKASDYHFRVARATGVQLEKFGVAHSLLKKSLNKQIPDLVFAGRDDVVRILKRMWNGRGYEAELKRLITSFQAIPDPNDMTAPKKLRLREQKRRERLIKNNLLRYNRQRKQLAKDWLVLASSEETDIDDLTRTRSSYQKTDSHLDKVKSRFRVISDTGSRPKLAYFYKPKKEEFKTRKPYPETMMGRPINSLDLQAIWQSEDGGIQMSDVYLEGLLPVSILTKIISDRQEMILSTRRKSGKYRLKQYFNHYDFKIGLGLVYLKRLVKNMGVESKVKPVLSFGLGTNDLSAAEVAKIFQTFISGKTYRFYKKGPQNQLTILKRVEDREGNILFKQQATSHQLFDEKYAMQIREILRRVVTHGTAKRARGELHVALNDKKNSPKIRIPSFGKTGTTNDFTTSYFAGFLPYPVEDHKKLDPENSFVMSAYVGYDRNKVMKNGRIRIYGGDGALPLWTDVAKDIIEEYDYASYMDKNDLRIISRKVWPLKFEGGVKAIEIDIPRGTVLDVSPNLSKPPRYASTDLSETGESYVNNFELTAGVKGIFYLIPKPNFIDEFQPWQKFALYDPAPEQVTFDESVEAVPTIETSKNTEKAEGSKGKKEFKEEDLF